MTGQGPWDELKESATESQVARLAGLKRGRNGRYCCPFGEHEHDATEPALAPLPRNGHSEPLRFHCHKCGETGSAIDVLVAALNVQPREAARVLAHDASVLFDRRERPEQERPARPRALPAIGDTVRFYGDDTERTVTAIYSYTDAEGSELYAVLRTNPKSFRPFKRASGGWTPGLPAERVLYRLPEVAEAIARVRRVYFCEGEKDADAVVQLGQVATTIAGGTGGWSKYAEQYRKQLEGAVVTIVADDDKAGRRFAATVARDLEGIADEVALVHPAEGKDVSDHLAAGRTLDELVPFTPESEPESAIEEPQPAEPTLTDTGNATRLIALHADRLRYLPLWGKWVAWSDAAGLWRLDYRDVLVHELAKDVGHALKADAATESDADRAKTMFTFGIRSLNAAGIRGMVDLARGIDGIPLDHEELDANGWLLGVENGVIDLHTGQLRDANPADLMTRQAHVQWDEDASAPRWDRALEEWFPDPELRGYVQRVAGAALVGAQHEHIFIVHYGTGRNGKGTFVRALQRVLGPYAVVVHLSLLIETRAREHDTVKSRLFRARLAVASETQRRVKLDEASVKNLTGGDRITARRMREDPWEFDPTHALWLQTNYLPEIAGRDTGIWSRVRVVKWDAVFDGREADPKLDEALASEAPGILRWLVEGCLAWQEHGLAEPDAVIRATLAYRQSEDTFTRFAADTGLVFRTGLVVGAADVQEMLGRWAQEEGVRPPRGLPDWLREHGASQDRERFSDDAGTRRQRRVWKNVGLNDGQSENEQVNVFV